MNEDVSSISAPFIHRPVATTLLTIALALAGAIAYRFLPVSPLPQVDFPSIQVSATLPGASPQTMASAVATPLERQFGRIAGITEMSSTSYLGSTSITIVFDLNRNIDAAARDVQAAINASAGNLPANLPSLPSYKKVNPADAPILILAITSATFKKTVTTQPALAAGGNTAQAPETDEPEQDADVYDKAKMYDAASSILAQQLSQLSGVGQVVVGGGALPAVRVDLNPPVLNTYGLSLEQVRTVLASANANRPKGELAAGAQSMSLATTDQLLKAKDYKPLIVAYVNGAPVRLSDVGDVTDSVEDLRTAGLSDGHGAVLLIIFRQPGANIIDTVDGVYADMAQLQAELPAAMRLRVVMDRTSTIRASVRDVESTLLLSIGLVILVVFVFLRNVRSTLIPSVAVPISLIGTFGIMYLCGYSIDNLSLMAMTIATGFVVDDAIVVIENITRHLEQGMQPMQAALLGAKEIGFTVVSISVSLVAVFIPILLMGGLVGRLFREFAVTLSVAIGVSMVVSLTTTPMMCAKLLKSHDQEKHGRAYQISEKAFDWILGIYESSLGWVLRHQFLTLLVALGTMGLTVYLYTIVPTDFFPKQDTGRLTGSIIADQDTSFQLMERLLNRFAVTVAKDKNPDGTRTIDNVIAFTGGGRGSTNQASMYVALTSVEERKVSADQVIDRLRPQLAKIAGATLVLQPVQDLRIGGRPSAALYQFTLQGDDLNELNDWAPKVLEVMRKLPGLADVTSDQQIRGLATNLIIDRATASRLGITPQNIDDTLYDAFGQRQVSTMYTALNQYHVVMEASQGFWENPEGLKYIYVQGSNGALVPLSAIAHFGPDNTPLAVNHTGQFPSITISFNLIGGLALGGAVTEIQNAEHDMGLPASIHGTFQGTAQAYQDAQAGQLILVACALFAVYIVLGVLYESFIHPITILSTIPSAGVGALLALLITHTSLTMIAFIGIILLIGIVKKNAIMMIDFALEAERKEGKTPEQAIFQACVLRFRPITMTTMAALLGGLPLAMGSGTGSELRRPLGIAIVGGLIFSQMLTLYTTPVIYLYMDRFRIWVAQMKGQPTEPTASPLQGPAHA